jgi:hypothetical protein
MTRVAFCVGAVTSPLLSNIVLDELDQELARRGHRFARYADDAKVYVRSERAGQRVMRSARCCPYWPALPSNRATPTRSRLCAGPASWARASEIRRTSALTARRSWLRSSLRRRSASPDRTRSAEYGTIAFAQTHRCASARTEPCARRLHSRRAIVPTGREPAMPMPRTPSRRPSHRGDRFTVTRSGWSRVVRVPRSAESELRIGRKGR